MIGMVAISTLDAKNASLENVFVPRVYDLEHVANIVDEMQDIARRRAKKGRTKKEKRQHSFVSTDMQF